VTSGSPWRQRLRPDTQAIERELNQIDTTVHAIMIQIDPANLPLLNARLTQLRRRKEHLQGELRIEKAAARDYDEMGMRRWARERIAGLADAIAGRRNERVHRVLRAILTRSQSIRRRGQV